MAMGAPFSDDGPGFALRAPRDDAALYDPVIAAFAFDHQPARFGRSGSGGVSTTAMGSGSAGWGGSGPVPLRSAASAVGPFARAASRSGRDCGASVSTSAVGRLWSWTPDCGAVASAAAEPSAEAGSFR